MNFFAAQGSGAVSGWCPSYLQRIFRKCGGCVRELPGYGGGRRFQFGMATTTDRRFRQPEHDILYFFREYFLTTFPQPPILRIQTRGIVFRIFLRPQPRKASEPSRVQPENQSELFLLRHAPRLRCAFGRAFLSFFSRLNSPYPARKRPSRALSPRESRLLFRSTWNRPGPAVGSKIDFLPARALGNNWAE